MAACMSEAMCSCWTVLSSSAAVASSRSQMNRSASRLA
ncbi:hypothetical protein M878_43950 [Streptomyces roseochromogenus subsp. oscitans DS 12.976]|uniref:Uncharacterized protein n=1 Tax=Streptomyces roseochromogenus subsp. oscitans DS 12.976 TaxID=1352936 RepID=V6JG42_STRRC|nr:hypothetical protein M878_43950 [Streptomyces roseochromogenus subsp. oscitans DS 12.976]